MEALEETPTGSRNSSSCNNIHNIINDNSKESTLAFAKGKRTKRPRPTASAAPTSSTSSAEFSGSTTTTIMTTFTTTEEDQDMANCLMLLAQGRGLTIPTNHRIDKTAASNYVYECKTCNKCFPSFQALGGHRTSHKKPKIEEKKPPSADKEDSVLRLSTNFVSKSTMDPTNNNKSGKLINSDKLRMHECSICGSEFSSGQALGGHMRRHRPINLPDNSESKKERTILSLDLNLPAPSDDDRPDFQKPPPLVVFSASTLVDCHY
ncbi:zinc finger protein ZAT5-like [Typha latifolia]|uniref:zinc finger protein ZAT5-like n=1 Tax=Typha latifolia TaxID=4733 RepID=UPI003C3047EC